MKFLSFLFICSAFLTSCSSYQEKVISRMDDVSDKPDWATLSKPVYEKEGKIWAVGLETGSANDKVTALSRIADNNARVELIKIVTNKVTSVFQNVQEGVSDGSELSRHMSTESSEVVTKNISPERKYWEKVLIPDENGEKVIKLRVFSLLSVPKSAIQKMIQDIADKDKGLSKELKSKVDKQLDKIIDQQ